MKRYHTPRRRAPLSIGRSLGLKAIPHRVADLPPLPTVRILSRGGRSHPYALLERYAPMFDVQRLLPLTGDSSDAEKAAARTFRRTCRSSANAHRMEGTRPTAVENEQDGLLGVAMLGLIALAKATAARDPIACRGITERLRVLLDCVDALVDFEEDLVVDILY
ncbi:hypothetical protein FKP32DRAFT_957474 [Trametes sanguinea]|nr:hypothetical protein FKP32DRAFT_957474 [Trametes sanguinea]